MVTDPVREPTNGDSTEQFMKFDYPETKDLLKTLLTLVSGVLVFSVTFAEKIIGLHDSGPSAQLMLILSWAAFVLALVLAGLAMCFIASAASKRIYGRTFFLDYLSAFTFALWSWRLAVLAGASFVFGLAVMATAGSLSLRAG